MTREQFQNLLIERKSKDGSFATSARLTPFEEGALWAFDTLALPVFHQFYGADEVPPEVIHEGDGQGYSQDVLIDMDGQQKHYAVGWYDHDDKVWCFEQDDISLLDLKHMTWTYIKRNDLTK